MRTSGRKNARHGPPDSSSALPAVVLAVHVQPRASRTEVAGLHGGALKIRLKAPPVDGAANDELVRFLADRLGVRRHDIEIAGGATARAKHVRIAGTGLTARGIVERLLGAGAP